jgi:putative ABC transport system ATP-binding protein
VLEIENVYKTFHEGTAHEVRALQGLSVQIEEGSFTVVIGTNGSGKSTLLNAVAGTFLVDRGRLRIDGTDVTRWPECRRAALLGRVF